MRLELRDLEYFSVIAEQKHIGRAAEALGLSQPALSRCLRRLETNLQARLFERTPKGVELTSVGSALLAHVDQLRLSLDDVVREALDLSRGLAGDLRVGSASGHAEYFMPAACSALLQSSNQTKLEVRVANVADLGAALHAGQLDLAIMGLPPPGAEHLVVEELYTEEFVVYAAANHRLARRKRVALADVADERWAVSAAHVSSWQRLHRVFQDSGLPPPRITMLSDSVWLRFATVARSDLLNYGSRRFMELAAPLAPQVVLPIEELAWRRRVGVVYRRGAYLSPVARRFMDIVKAAATDLSRMPAE